MELLLLILVIAAIAFAVLVQKQKQRSTQIDKPKRQAQQAQVRELPQEQMQGETQKPGSDVRNSRDSAINKRNLLTRSEIRFYTQLQQELPEYTVLCQVAFGALLKTKTAMTRNRFAGKYADFVVCDNQFNVIAIIELDDPSHDGREGEDAYREGLLTEAGYKVIRFRGLPEGGKVREQIRLLTSANSHT